MELWCLRAHHEASATHFRKETSGIIEIKPYDNKAPFVAAYDT
jgi:hypothetical protein